MWCLFTDKIPPFNVNSQSACLLCREWDHRGDLCKRSSHNKPKNYDFYSLYQQTLKHFSETVIYTTRCFLNWPPFSFIRIFKKATIFLLFTTKAHATSLLYKKHIKTSTLTFTHLHTLTFTHTHTYTHSLTFPINTKTLNQTA